MAEWNKGKVLPSVINGGQEFTKKDNLAINELNAIVNNSFYASEKAENAERLVEEALSGNIDLDNYYTKDETYSKEEVKNLIDNIEVGGGSSVVVDSELDAESENPVQNKVITQALDNRYTKDETYSQQQVDDLISGIETGDETDLTNYYTKDETYSKEEVDDLIDNIETGGTGGGVSTQEFNELRGTVLWRNPTPTNSFTPQTITLSNDNYDELEIYYRKTTSANAILKTNMIKGFSTLCSLVQGDASAGCTNFYRYTNYINSTRISFEDAWYAYGDSGETKKNDWIIPVYVVGIKRNIL